MADITDPAIVDYSNEQVRTGADLVAGLHKWIRFQRVKYNLNIAPLVTANGYVPTDRIIDGASVVNGLPDGRTPVLLGDMQTWDSRLAQIEAILDAPFAIDVVDKFATNPRWPLSSD